MKVNRSMRKMKWILAAVLASCVLWGTHLPAQNMPGAEKKIVGFEEDTRANPIPDGCNLFIGSSSIEIWGKRFAPTSTETLVWRGIGGTNYEFLVRNAERLLSGCKPKRIFVYSGDNDIGDDGSEALGDKVAAKVKELVTLIEEKQPQARIYILSVKPSIKRAAAEPAQKQANEGIQKLAAEKPDKVRFLDMRPSLLDEAGKPKPEFFAPDGLHLNEKGYAQWNEIIQKILSE